MLFNLIFRKELQAERDDLHCMLMDAKKEVGRLTGLNKTLVAECDQLRADWRTKSSRSRCECLDMVTKLSEENSLLKSKLVQAQKWWAEVQKQKNNATLSCAYCGEEYPPGTPASQGTALYKHIKNCPAHPMRKLLNFVRHINSHITNTANSGYIWSNMSAASVKRMCKELLK